MKRHGGRAAADLGSATVDQIKAFIATVPGKMALGGAGALVVLALVLSLGGRSSGPKSAAELGLDPDLSRRFQNDLSAPLSLAILTPRPSVAVNSYPVAATRPLSDWQTDPRKTMGWIDTASLVTVTGTPRQTPNLTNEDLLVVSGWAGEMDIGIRIHRVLLVICDRVVATTTAGLPRPDVAEKVHSNLAQSGWSAKLAIGHLPRCQDAALTAWGTNRTGKMLFPLAGRVQLPLPPVDPLLSLKYLTSPPPFAPGDDPPSPVRFVSFLNKKTALLRTPAKTGTTIDQMDGGRYPATILEEMPDWLQLVVGDKAGWVPRSSIKLEN